jgi:peptidyl-prolyl cis-trans isomerase B (cyclophilin B)
VRLYHRATASFLVASAVLLGGCGRIVQDGLHPVPDNSTAAGQDTVGACEYVPTGEAAKPVNPPPSTGVPTSGSIRYVLQMTEGDVTITMDRAKAPCTVNSFVSLASQGYFDKTRCHRLADSGIFILQCGDPTGTGQGGPGYQFANETDGTESYTRGVVAMANAGPGTNGSQFFLVWDDSTSLDEAPDYTIFGALDPAGRDVVAAMAAEGQDGSNPDGTGRPNNPSEIMRVAPA